MSAYCYLWTRCGSDHSRHRRRSHRTMFINKRNGALFGLSLLFLCNDSKSKTIFSVSCIHHRSVSVLCVVREPKRPRNLNAERKCVDLWRSEDKRQLFSPNICNLLPNMFEWLMWLFSLFLLRSEKIAKKAETAQQNVGVALDEIVFPKGVQMSADGIASIVCCLTFEMRHRPNEFNRFGQVYLLILNLNYTPRVDFRNSQTTNSMLLRLSVGLGSWVLASNYRTYEYFVIASEVDGTWFSQSISMDCFYFRVSQ